MKIAIIGELDQTFRPHVATNESIQHVQKLLNIKLQAEWVSTEFLNTNLDSVLKEFQGFWIAPGSPYKSMKGAIDLISHTRSTKIPTFGTCGGFQHMAIEFARNVLKIDEAEHAEYDPYASRLVVNPLSCDLKGETLQIYLKDKKSKVHSIYGADSVKEKYYCNFGINPEYQDEFDKNGFKVVVIDEHKEARILELDKHPFFITTLFVPQDNSSFENPHKLILEFIRNIWDGTY